MIGTLLMYFFTVLFLLSSKVVLMDLNRRHEIGIWGLILFSLIEVLIVSVIYVMITLLVKQNGTSAAGMFPRSLLCIFLILVIPYIIAYLYGYAHGLKLQSGVKTPRNDGTLVVSIHDNKGNIKLSLRIMDILYAVSEDNYVKVFYEQDGIVKNSLIRTTAKNIEDDLEGQITRCHRSYLVNLNHVKMLKHSSGKAVIVLSDNTGTQIPVSRNYYKELRKFIVPEKIIKST
jgi:hypothetical protein